MDVVSGGAGAVPVSSGAASGFEIILGEYTFIFASIDVEPLLAAVASIDPAINASPQAASVLLASVALNTKASP